VKRTLAWSMLTLMTALVPAEALAQQGANPDYFSNGAAVTGVPTSGRAASYFSNGAAVTGVPTSGPAASYFTNGAQATTVPTSVMPSYSFSPPFASVAPQTGDSGAPEPAATRVETAASASTSSAGVGVAAPASPAETVPTRTEAVPESTAATLASTPASESGFTLASQVGPEPTSGPPSAPERAASRGLEPTQATEDASGPAPRVTPSEVLWAMLVGTVFATILVFFGTRIRSRNPSAGRPRRFPS
jgi:hypothetical protein